MAKILILEDDPEMRDGLASLLASRGHETTTASDGASGLKAARLGRPDLVISDVMMAYDTDGFEFVRRLSEAPETRGTPVILITGIRKAQGLTEAPAPDPQWLPVEEVIEKPFKPAALLKAVERALKKKSA